MADTARKVVVIGSGPAGLTAALYTARANLKPLLVEGLEAGGQLMLTTMVENWPGFRDGIMGPDLMAEMRLQAERFGTETMQGNVTAVDLQSRPFAISFADGRTVTAESLIVATGASARWLGLPSEQAFMGFGVSACATCDGFFFRGKDVAVVGGGNSAVEEALFLTNFATSVKVIHRRDALRAEKILQDRLFRNPKIEMVWDSAVEEILGGGTPPGVEGVRVRNLKSDAVAEIPLHGVFVAIGHTPNTELFRGHVDMDNEGYIRTAPDSTVTSVAGIFAAGDVQDKIYRQAVTAAGTGCMAALEVERFVAEHAQIAAE
jgi:thioredoxin reductase (NADPH)